MVNTEQINTRLDDISRKFVHRTNLGESKGFQSPSELCEASLDAKQMLKTLDHSESLHSKLSEYWLRLLNDVVSYSEEWPLDLSNEEDTQNFVDLFEAFNDDLEDRYNSFTQTQRTRVLSIAMRARQATMQPVLSNTIEKYGSTLELDS